MSLKYWPETLTQNLVAHYGKVHWSTLGRKNNRTILGSTYPLAHYGQNMVLQLGTSGDLTPPGPSHLHSKALLLFPQVAVCPQKSLEVLPHSGTLL